MSHLDGLPHRKLSFSHCQGQKKESAYNLTLSVPTSEQDQEMLGSFRLHGDQAVVEPSGEREGLPPGFFVFEVDPAEVVEDIVIGIESSMDQEELTSSMERYLA